MWSTLFILFFLTFTNNGLVEGSNCSDLWFDCGNGKCVAYMWLCDNDNDCGNNKDEENCEGGVPPKACLSSQFQCLSDGHCISETWHCDGEHDCDDRSDERNCQNNTHCHGFRCDDNHCIPQTWRCDGNLDCLDGSDEGDQCPKTQLCSPTEFTCSSGTCLDRKLVCDGKKDCSDASDEGKNCSDVCANHTCSQKCRNSPHGPECFCNDGYSLTKDNTTCTDIDECRIEGTCSQHCTNLIGNFKCSCMDGYDLENNTCKAHGSEPLLIFSTLEEIRAIYLRTKRYFLIQKAIFKAAAVDADPIDSRVYWVEISNKSAVYSSRIDGSGFEIVLNNGLMIPEDIAVDYIGRNLYFTDSGLKQILACKMNGAMCHVLHNSNIEKPRAIAVDPPEGFLYWSDWGDNSSGIYRSGMDGSRRVVLVSKNIKWPNGITVDHTTNRLYWTDAHLQTIEYITLDGSIRRMLLKEEIFHPYSVAVFEDNLYWSDWNTFSLETCNKFTAHKMNVMTRENGKHIMGVHVYHPVQARTANNPCWSNTCSHMCLIVPLNSYKCVCPPGFTLSLNGRTCLVDETFPMLLVNDETTIYHIRPEAVGSSAMTELPITHIDTVGRLAYDWKSKTLFLADSKSPAIYAINFTTLAKREVIKNHLVTPEDIAFDWMSENLYWVDSSKGTVEVINPASSITVVLIVDLAKPSAIALAPQTGRMFISTTGEDSYVAMYNMDGTNKVTLNSLSASVIALAVHPLQSLLYMADPQIGTISYLDYQSPRSEPRILKYRLGNVMSIAVSEKYIYWSDSRNHVLSFMKHNATVSHAIDLPGHKDGLSQRKILYASTPVLSRSIAYPCSINNGGCSHLCVTAATGKSCACPTGMILSNNGATCTNKECTSEEFKCKNTKKCIPKDFVCDGFNDCDDGSDESCEGPGKRCPGNDFKCDNGRCILFAWKCDRRDDCGDNSDEKSCPVSTKCAKDQFPCGNGECIPTLWRCDGENDCIDHIDETNCNNTACDGDTQIRCGNGQCIPVSWACDGTPDCVDKSDEMNCTIKPKTCSFKEFRCADETCIDKTLVCDQRNDCEDGSDEKNCTHSKAFCENDNHMCKDGLCIYAHEVCDGTKDCSDGGDEVNCTRTAAQCSLEEYFCKNNSRCISRRWICDGDNDCGDAADEDPVNCTAIVKPTLPPFNLLLQCEDFFCKFSGECISWSKVCDGHNDCEDLTDEGHLCSRSCTGNNGGCSQKCQKTPDGSKCSCFQGYNLMNDKMACEDIDECSIPGSCSHFCNNTKGGFKCACAEGYSLTSDYKHCKAEGDHGTLVYLLPDRIRSIDLFSHSQRVYFVDNLADMRGLDYDASDAIFFYADWKHGTINRYTLSTNKREVMLTSMIRPHFLRWDWIVRNLYYTDDEGSVTACTVTGKYCTTVIKNAAPHLNSFDISPKNGLMFWTVWSVIIHENSGIIERADMDGGNRMGIVTDNVIWPSAITVDHVLNKIYWTDSSLNILECSDFQGRERRNIVRGDMYNPLSMAIFEDHVYWSDWGSDTLFRCGKFDGKNCINLHSNNVKAEVIMVVHKVNQPKGVNRCQSNNCQHLCLPSLSGSSCKCADGYEFINSSCTFVPTEMPTYKPKVVCPSDHCLKGGTCVVVGGEIYCQCTPEYIGDRCEQRLAIAGPEPGHDYSWIAIVILAVAVIGGIIGAILLCRQNRERLSKMSENVAVSFRKSGFGRKSGRLIVDTDDGGACDELMLGRTGSFKQSKSFGNPLFGKKPRAFPDAESQDGEFKRWPSYDSGDSAFVSESQTRENSEQCIDEIPLGGSTKATDRIAQFFRRL